MDCPFCAEDIKDNASVCKHCGRDLLAIRPLLDRLQTHDKRLEGHDTDLAKLAQFVQRRAHRRSFTADGAIPALSPVSATILCVVALFIVSLFFELVVHARGRDQLAPEIPALAFFIVTFAFGFLSQPARERPLMTDLTGGVVITVLSTLVRHFAWIALRPTQDLLPSNPEVWKGLALLAVSTFLSYTAGGFVRYLVLSHVREKPPITYATDLSRFLVSRHLIDPTTVDTQMKSLESIFHSLGAIAATVAALLGTWQAIDKLGHAAPAPLAPVIAAPAPPRSNG